MYHDTFYPHTFSSSDSSSLREEILAFAASEYSTTPEYLWAKNPRFAVLRHKDSRKWFGLIMDVPRERLGLGEDASSLTASPEVDILNVKCDPMLSGSLRMQTGILPGYHMNKGNWISILLDGTVNIEQIFTLLDMSYELTASKKKTKSTAVHNTNWLIPANPKYYDIETALAEHPDEPFFWKQSNNIFVGDIVHHLHKGRPSQDALPRFSGVTVFARDFKVLIFRVLAQAFLLSLQAVAFRLGGRGNTGINVTFLFHILTSFGCSLLHGSPCMINISESGIPANSQDAQGFSLKTMRNAQKKPTALMTAGKNMVLCLFLVKILYPI